MNKLTDEELEIAEWNIIKRYLQSADKEQHFYYVLWSNYSSNHKGLEWLISNPDTDISSIFAIYYNLEPSYYTQYKSVDEVDSTELITYNVLMSIEKNIINDFYKNRTIHFSPSEWMEVFDDTVPRPIPLFMRQEIKGDELISSDYPDGYDEGLTLSTYTRIWELYQ